MVGCGIRGGEGRPLGLLATAPLVLPLLHILLPQFPLHRLNSFLSLGRHLVELRVVVNAYIVDIEP